MFSDGILVWPETLRELFVNDRHPLAVAGVMLGEKPAFQQRDIHGSEVVGTCEAAVRLQFLPGRRSIAFHVDPAPSDRSAQRQHINQPLGLDAGQVTDALSYL